MAVVPLWANRLHTGTTRVEEIDHVPVQAIGHRISLDELVQPRFGLLRESATAVTDADEPNMTAFTVSAGDMAALAKNWTPRTSPIRVRGTGAAPDRSSCRLPALAEALERYSAARYHAVESVMASANELGQDALDLDTIPHCSAKELRHPKAPLAMPRKDVPIRWVKAISLHDAGIVWVPLVMAFMHIHPVLPGENFWLQISTGCAAHTSYEEALIRAIHEVIERDAVSLLWLQRLPLPRIEFDANLPEQARSPERLIVGRRNVEYQFYNATTDLGIPTVYGCQLAPNHTYARTLVSCSTAPTFVEAIGKVIRDMGVLRIRFQKRATFPSTLEAFNEVSHGATYMAREEMEEQFGFLVNSGKRTKLTELLRHDHSTGTLKHVLAILKKRGLAVYAVDLSTDEARRCGMRVVRAIIPGLQPLSFNYLAQFRGHSRLYEAPSAMGYTTCDEDGLNPWPQPFM